MNAAARRAPISNAASEPANVVSVAHRSEVRYEAVLLPNSVATPLKLSFAPFAAATAAAPRISNRPFTLRPVRGFVCRAARGRHPPDLDGGVSWEGSPSHPGSAGRRH